MLFCSRFCTPSISACLRSLLSLICPGPFCWEISRALLASGVLRQLCQACTKLFRVGADCSIRNIGKLKSASTQALWFHARTILRLIVPASMSGPVVERDLLLACWIMFH